MPRAMPGKIRGMLGKLPAMPGIPRATRDTPLAKRGDFLHLAACSGLKYTGTSPCSMVGTVETGGVG